MGDAAPTVLCSRPIYSLPDERAVPRPHDDKATTGPAPAISSVLGATHTLRPVGGYGGAAKKKP